MHSPGASVPFASCAHRPVVVLQLYITTGGVGLGVGLGGGGAGGGVAAQKEVKSFTAQSQ
jgi:hypothetical protein